MRLFVDTSAFIALEDRSDARHREARAFYERLTPSDRLFTSNYVVDETVTRLRFSLGAKAALSFGETILDSRLCALLYVDRDVETQALGFLKKFSDQRLSFTDCTTMAFLRAQRLDAVFAFDEDFSRAGFRSLP